MGLTNLRKRKSLGDGDGKFTACYLLDKLFQATGIRDRPHLLDLKVAPIGRLRVQNYRLEGRDEGHSTCRRQWPGLRFF